jgi:hypothetical protein
MRLMAVFPRALSSAGADVVAHLLASKLFTSGGMSPPPQEAFMRQSAMQVAAFIESSPSTDLVDQSRKAHQSSIFGDQVKGTRGCPRLDRHKSDEKSGLHPIESAQQAQRELCEEQFFMERALLMQVHTDFAHGVT